VRQVSAPEDRLSWSDGISSRVDWRLVALDVFLCGVELGDGDFLDLAESILGLSGMGEQEDSDELLCFLEVENMVNDFIEQETIVTWFL
jgi:hypothetical protein